MSLYDQLGGKPGIGRLVADFYARISSDPGLDQWFARADHTRYRAQLRAYFAVSLGGPEEYRGGDLRTVHGDMGISRAAFDTVIDHLSAALVAVEADPDVARKVTRELRSLRAIVVTPPGS
ncbi:group I truncated hemoglobin [Lacisediminihabitans profunda]|uniref:Group 1 truncated hemoglobin n=1 Tax=Lacisediminihabitans profunda TaxID=2594790 RepID=A0A5C8UPU3_9MICO|nr:group 1 truncated hemoglobin [Lacisediminihabitans profunda]TXN30314.1 group 1 truncated hemoglobin [Lacisediminihabitans profunda]